MMEKTSLYPEHIDLSAKMVPFCGYEMPINYPSGIKSECFAVRNNVVPQFMSVLTIVCFKELSRTEPASKFFPVRNSAARHPILRLRPYNKFSLLQRTESG